MRDRRRLAIHIRREPCTDMQHDKPLTFGSLFAGIGGLDLGLENSGMQCKWQVEIENRCRNWLSAKWPKVEQFADVQEFEPTTKVDLICGGFPCQNLSSANVKTRKGLEGAKSGLWREFRRVIEQANPTWVVVENVANWREWVPSVRRDLFRLGFTSVPIQLCPSQFGAYHRRPRVFVVANSNGQGESLGALYDEVASLQAATRNARTKFKDPTRLVPRTDGLSQWMARAYGNAVVPAVAEWIGKRIVAAS